MASNPRARRPRSWPALSQPAICSGVHPHEARSHEGLCPSRHAGDLGPGLKGLGPGGSVLAGGEVIAAEVEEVVDLVVSGEKPLGLTG